MVLRFLLFENASGFALFERVQSEEIGEQLDEVQRSIADFSQFSKLVKLKGFAPFTSAEASLACINDVSEGIMNEALKVFLENQGIAKGKGKKSFALGVVDPRLAGSIKEGTQIDCECNEMVVELCRGIRQHIDKFLKGLEHGDIEKAQVGLAHSFSRSKVKFNVNRADNMIIQAICILDQIDKDINTFAMRVREWYSWHFPELGKIVSDMKTYVPIAHFIQSKRSLLDEDKRAKLVDVCDGNEELAKRIADAARASIGADLSEIDMLNINTFSTRVLSLMEYRQNLFDYLHTRMNAVAPNLTALVGEQVGARLIAKAGSLTNLSKAPASTVQILGAEKALFRALKTKGNTPKYGLIYHSTFIGRAAAKNKGRISRFLANKCSMASRIDCFSDEPSDVFGKGFREQVEERLEFFSSGKVPRKNLDVVHTAIKSLSDGPKDEDKKSKKKRKAAEDTGAAEEPKSKGKEKEKEKEKEKDKKKSKKDKAEEPADEPADEEKPKKKRAKTSKD